MEVKRTNDKHTLTNLTRWVLAHKRLVAGVWLAITLAAFVAVGPANKALSQQFPIPGREGFETNKQIDALYGSGGDGAPLVPVVQLRRGMTVNSSGVAEQFDAAVAKVKAVVPGSRVASYGSTHNRAFVSK